MSVNYRQKSWETRFLEMQLLGMLTLRNFTELSILTPEIDSENFRLIPQRLAILQNNLWNAENSWKRPIKSELGHVTSPNSFGDVMSSIWKHWPSFSSFWWVEPKSAFYKDQTRIQILQNFSKIWSALYWFLA